MVYDVTVFLPVPKGGIKLQISSTFNDNINISPIIVASKMSNTEVFNKSPQYWTPLLQDSLDFTQKES